MSILSFLAFNLLIFVGGKINKICFKRLSGSTVNKKMGLELNVTAKISNRTSVREFEMSIAHL